MDYKILFEGNEMKKKHQELNAKRKIIKSDIYRKYHFKDEVTLMREIKELERELNEKHKS